MKIGIYGCPGLTPGKRAVKDPRLDQVHKITGSKQRTYLQVELVGEDAFMEADAFLLPQESRSDLILRDLEFVETRLARTQQEAERKLLEKMKGALEAEQCLSTLSFTDDEKGLMASYGLLTNKPLITASQAELEEPEVLLCRALQESGFTGFFTTGEKETRSWIIRRGTTAWEAAGVIHSDIQKGFIRAEVISFADFIQAGGETPAKQAGKMRLEQKGYIMQEADITVFRFNK